MSFVNLFGSQVVGPAILFGAVLSGLAPFAHAEPSQLDMSAAYCATYWQSEKKLTDENIQHFTASTPKAMKQAMQNTNETFSGYLKHYEEYRATRISAVQDSVLSKAVDNANADILQSGQDVARCAKDSAGSDNAVGSCVMGSEALQRTRLCDDAFVQRLAVATGLPGKAVPVTLSAAPGQFDFQVVGTSAKKVVVSASIRLTRFSDTEGWPPAAYLGFFQGEDRNNSVQFLVIRNKKEDTFLVAGYRIVENGAEVKSVALTNMPLDSKTNVTVSMENGLVTVSLPPRVLVSFQTDLGEVTPYISVSSGAAQFSVTREK
ncbi:hypothetical protein [Silvimonas iriomotensis]|uniref:Uncharacterized protein n=1 Tax=Silvimonas iriomotensis TaxID=449662 RepID=A0ABQ2P9V9_9NEIS|nr:hypothetical protein [Silvimonas iriomotensis]GGP22041.1 hypothetical protein GCM10010970_23090 [Silvimonas iriomotensis]